MKIAYIGYDSSCTKGHSFFRKHDFEVTYFLKVKRQNFNYQPFLANDIFLENLTIPGDLALRTVHQSQVFNTVGDEYLELKNNLNPSAAATLLEDKDKDKDTAEPENIKVLDMTLIKDLQYDGKQKKIFLELEKKGVENFDFVFIEAHPFISTALLEKNIKAFRDQLELEYVWSSVSFDIDYQKPVEPFIKQKTFIVVQDSLRRSLVDNWYFCDFQPGNKLNVWGYLPYRQVANPEFKKFYVDRVRNFIQQKFKFIYLKEFIQFDLCSVGALDSAVSMKFQQMLAVPNFMFWSQLQVFNFFELNFSKKIKSYKLAHQGVRRD